MKREDRLRAALKSIAETSDHVNHAYLICGRCMASRALYEDDEALAKRKPAKAAK